MARQGTHFASRKAEGYLRLFAQAPSAITNMAERDRAAFFPVWIKEWQAKETPTVFAPAVKRLADAWKAVVAAEALVIEAQKGLEKARLGEEAARKAWLAGYRRLHAQLTDANCETDRLIENQIAEAVDYFKKKHGCKLFNVSLADSRRPYDGVRVGPWASVLDDLARQTR